MPLNLRVWKMKDGTSMKPNSSCRGINAGKACVLTGFWSDKHCDSVCSPAWPAGSVFSRIRYLNNSDTSCVSNHRLAVALATIQRFHINQDEAVIHFMTVWFTQLWVTHLLPEVHKTAGLFLLYILLPMPRRLCDLSCKKSACLKMYHYSNLITEFIKIWSRNIGHWTKCGSFLPMGLS